jgi:hypothetical protein
VLIEHGDRDQVQIEEAAAVANANTQVKERLAMVGVVVANQQHGPHGIIVEHVGDLVQRGGNKDADVLCDDQVVHPTQLGILGAILRMLDGNRYLMERHVDRDVVHGQLKSHDILDNDRVMRIVVILDK